jgi:hypothetical protein
VRPGVVVAIVLIVAGLRSLNSRMPDPDRDAERLKYCYTSA